MLATKRRHEPSVVQRLLDTPQRFDFFQAVRILEHWFGQQGLSQESAIASYLRFRNTLSLAFPASEIEALQVELDGVPASERLSEAELAAALAEGRLTRLSITPSFMGFLGGGGTLPAHYTESIAAHQLYLRDDSPRAFLDIFSNRALALFYQAWRKYRLEFKHTPEQDDGFLPVLKSLAGIGQRGLGKRLQDDRANVLDETLAYYAGTLRHRPASAAMIRNVLEEYFGVPFAIEQFVGGWYEVPADQRSCLGGGNAVLGVTAMAGSRVWQRDLCMRVVVGPLCRRDFARFLPRGSAAAALEKFLTMFTSTTLEYEVQVVLRAEDVQRMQLQDEQDGGQLGWNTFLVSGHEKVDRGDVSYRIHALH